MYKIYSFLRKPDQPILGINIKFSTKQIYSNQTKKEVKIYLVKI